MKAVVSILAVSALVSIAHAAEKKPFTLIGVFIDSCSCSVPCKCDLTGDVPKGCQGMGAIRITAGTYGGHDLSGVTIAYVGHAGDWSRLYIDAPDQAHRKAAEEFGRAYSADFAPVDEVKDAKIAVSGTAGAYSVMIDGGALMKFSTAAVMGGDGKTPLAHTNSLVSICPTLFQGKSAAESTYHDGDRSMHVDQGRNVYFNDNMDSRGEL